MEHQNVVELDVRPQLKAKVEPFQLIMDTVKKLNKEDTFVLHATFKPTPLLGVMKMKGYIYKVEKNERKHWVVTFVHKDYCNLLGGEETQESSLTEKLRSKKMKEELREPQTIQLNNRGLEPPQPMMRTLAALDRSEPGDVVHIHNDRVPVFLIEELNQLGCPFEIEEQEDGSAKVKIQKV